jgi:hypothetical protein
MKPRSDSYEATLTDEQREELHAWLSQPDLSLAEVRRLAPKWAGGPHDGSPPSIATLSGIGSRLRQEAMLLNVEATAKLMEAVRQKVGAHSRELQSEQSLEQTLDTVCDLVGQEVLQKTLEREDPKNRTAALRALLKRADQKLTDRRVKLLEQEAAQAQKAKAVTADKSLTPEEKQLRLKQIFGMG